jgi:SAM-dependent methyltransferase
MPKIMTRAEADSGAPPPTAPQAPSPSPAEMFDRFFGPALFEPWAEELLRHARPQPGEQVLDLACGTGVVARRLAPLVGAAGRVVGVDINPAMLGVARARPAADGASIAWRQGDATSLDLPEQSFDLVVCQQGLQFFDDRPAALRQVRRVLRSDGRLALGVWAGLERHPVYQRLCEAEARELGVPVAAVAAPWSLPDAGEIGRLLAGAGFDRVALIPTSLDVRFPSAKRFVGLTLFAASAFLPHFDWSDEAFRQRLIATVSRAAAPVLDEHRDGEGLRFSTSCNIAVARRGAGE